MQRPKFQRWEAARKKPEIALSQARAPRKSAPPEELSLALEAPRFALRLQVQGQSHGGADFLGVRAW
eukprot:2972726-Alexandrium_andersonii.AAC.1